MLKKTRERLGKIVTVAMELLSKIDPKSSYKSRKTAFAAEVEKKTLPGTAFDRKNSIFSKFWGPRGNPKIAKNLRGVLSKGVLGAIW